MNFTSNCFLFAVLGVTMSSFLRNVFSYDKRKKNKNALYNMSNSEYSCHLRSKQSD